MINFLLDSLWVFFIVFVIPIILFVGLYRIGKFLINLINKKFHKQFSSSWAYLLLIPLPLFFMLFLAGGCSFKYIDPQYYKFIKLCQNVNNEVTIYNKDYWEIFSNREKGNTRHDDKGEYYYNENLNQKIYFDYTKAESINVSQKKNFTLTKTIFEDYYNNIHYANHSMYFYDDYGIFLIGDEGAGFKLRFYQYYYCK